MKEEIRSLTLLELETMSFRNRYAGAIVITQDLKILLQQRGEDWDQFPGYIVAFGGKSAPSETMMEALIRELKEELGADVKPWEVINLGRFAIGEQDGPQDLLEVSYWQDRNKTITGCYEGEAIFFNTVEEILAHPKLISELRWIFKKFSTKQLLVSANDEIQIEPYSPQWPGLAKLEIAMLEKQANFPWVVGFDHIGSTCSARSGS